MAKPYYKLISERSYLQKIQTGTGKTLEKPDAERCESYADAYIDGVLGKSFDPTPPLIAHIAELLGSAKSIHYLFTGRTPNISEYAAALQEEADKLLVKIRDGELLVVNADGSFCPVGSIVQSSSYEEMEAVFHPFKEPHEYQQQKEAYGP